MVNVAPRETASAVGVFGRCAGHRLCQSADEVVLELAFQAQSDRNSVLILTRSYLVRVRADLNALDFEGSTTAHVASFLHVDVLTGKFEFSILRKPTKTR